MVSRLHSHLTFTLLLVALSCAHEHDNICWQEMCALRVAATKLCLVESTEAAPWIMPPIKVPDKGHMQLVHTAESERYPSAAPQASSMLEAHAC